MGLGQKPCPRRHALPSRVVQPFCPNSVVLLHAYVQNVLTYWECDLAAVRTYAFVGEVARVVDGRVVGAFDKEARSPRQGGELRGELMNCDSPWGPRKVCTRMAPTRWPPPEQTTMCVVHWASTGTMRSNAIWTHSGDSWAVQPSESTLPMHVAWEEPVLSVPWPCLRRFAGSGSKGPGQFPSPCCLPQARGQLAGTTCKLWANRTIHVGHRTRS